MESWLQLALVLEATTLAYAASVPQILGSPHFRQIMKAIDTYNTVLDTKSYFQLFSTELPHTQSGEMKLKFTIKETLCPRATQEDTQGCAFTDDGEVRNCTATFNGSDMRNLVVRCDTVTAVKIEEKNEEKEKSNNIDFRQMKKRSTKILSSNRKVNNSTTNSISCLQCIFDIFGTGV